MPGYFKLTNKVKGDLCVSRNPSAVVAVLFMILCFTCSPAYSQHKLSSHVQLPEFSGSTVRAVFDTLKQKYAVLFSYNSKLLDLDATVHVAGYEGPLIGYLEKVLGETYSFKETKSHIIITYAPQRMDVSAVNIDTARNSRTMISGYVKDIRTNRPVGFASVYDRTTFQGAALTSHNGYFELDIKHPAHTVTIALSKENYRDTMLVLILPVEVFHTSKRRKVGFYHTNDSSKSISRSAFGRAFTNARQRTQNLNLGGFFVYSPIQVSMTPWLSTHGLFNSQVVNKFSLNVIGGYTAGVTGTELAGAFNINQFNMHGVQAAGVFNVVGGDVGGVQLAGALNVGLNKLSGIQLAGAWNSADTVAGGVQLSGAINLANRAARGIQVAGMMNIAREEAGSQIAGGINVAKNVHGIQFAIINIADSSDYPIGVLNWIKNGFRQFSLGIDQSRFLAFSFKSGGRVMYSVLGIGTYLNDGRFTYGFEAGIGAQLLKRRHFSLAAEFINRTHFDSGFTYYPTGLSSLRVIPAIRLGRHFHIYAAPSLTYTDAIHPESETPGAIWKFWNADPKRNTWHGGGTVGLAYTLF